MTRSLPFVLALTVVACSSQYTTPEAGPAPPAPKQPPPTAGASLVTLAPGSNRYLLHQQVHYQQDVTGLPPTVDLGYGFYLTTAIADTADSVGYPTTFTIDSVTVDSGSRFPPGVDLAASRGLKIIGRLSRTGEFVDPMPSDSGTAASLGNLMPRFRNFFPRLPEGGVVPDTSWTDTTQATDSFPASTVTNTSINHRSATTWEERDGVRALRLEVTATFQFQGSSEVTGSTLTFKGTGTASGVQFLSADGRFLGGEATDSTNLTIDLPAGYSFPRQQVVHTRVTALP